jgi:hypothetical protein
MTIALAIFFLFTLTYLHFAFVGSAGCLPQLLGTYNTTSIADDVILHINIGTSFSPDDSGVRDLNGGEFVIPIKRWPSIRNTVPSLLSRSSLHKSLNMISSHAVSRSLGHFPSYYSAHTVSNYMMNSSRVMSNYTDDNYDYEFSFHIGELLLPRKVQRLHNFTVLNVTMSGSKCFGSSFTRFLLPLGGLDTIIVNNLMFTFHKSGSVMTADGDYYRWKTEDTEGYDTIIDWIGFKLLIVLISVFAFFLLSTATALLVRVLISSGVVILLPIFALFQV